MNKTKSYQTNSNCDVKTTRTNKQTNGQVTAGMTSTRKPDSATRFVMRLALSTSIGFADERPDLFLSSTGRMNTWLDSGMRRWETSCGNQKGMIWATLRATNAT